VESDLLVADKIGLVDLRPTLLEIDISHSLMLIVEIVDKDDIPDSKGVCPVRVAVDEVPCWFL